MLNFAEDIPGGISPKESTGQHLLPIRTKASAGFPAGDLDPKNRMTQS